jgi:F-type H+-transporting ATPase subunit a
VPQGTQTMLITFIVIIEIISNLIRPGTQAVRLTANIIAGHLLLTLLGNNGSSIRHTLLLSPGDVLENSNVIVVFCTI